jgi:hypothetical protein
VKGTGDRVASTLCRETTFLAPFSPGRSGGSTTARPNKACASQAVVRFHVVEAASVLSMVR